MDSMKLKGFGSGTDLLFKAYARIGAQRRALVDTLTVGRYPHPGAEDSSLMDEEYKKYLVSLGARIRARRKECNLKMRDIMIAAGYYDAQWRKYETGGPMNLASLLKIASVSQTTPSVLLEGIPLPRLPYEPLLADSDSSQS
jgi:hypothetical protein